MEVANPCVQKEWDEWKRKMEENGGVEWRETVSCWAKVEASDEEEEEEEENDDEEKEDDADSNEQEVNKESNEAGWKGVEMEEMGKRKDEEETDEVKEVENTEEEEENEEEREVTGTEEMKGDEEKEVEREKLEEKKVKEAEEWEEVGGNEVESEEMEEDDNEMEVGQQAEGREMVGDEFCREVKEETEGEEGAEGQTDEDEEIDRGLMEAGEREEEGELEGTSFRLKEELNDQEDREVTEEEQVKEADDEEDRQHEEEQIGHYDLSSPEEEEEDEEGTIKEEDEALDSDESNDEDSDWMESEDESCISEESGRNNQSELKNPDETSERSENSTMGASPPEERREENHSEGITDEEESESVTDSWTAHVEEFQDDKETVQEVEEDSTDDEDGDDEDVVKLCCKDDYPTNVFHTLKEFRDSFLLTDLNLSTEDGRSLHVHSPVLAAVSSLIQESLSRNTQERKDDGSVVGPNTRSLSLGSEVDRVGLEAVVEFAYSGSISQLNEDTVGQIKAAAQRLGAPRVLDLCAEEEESTEGGGQERKERISAAEQMRISLQSIKQLWTDKLGCDVVLEAISKPLHVHRAILAASSDYFRGMFTLGMRESHQARVSLPFLSASELEVLISCSYSGVLPLSWTNVFEITSTALQLQYQPALPLCLQFLQQEINPHSCLDVASFAEAYEMAQLLEVADDFVLRQFQKVACTSKFKDLPAKNLLKYLNSHSLCVPSELVVFKAVVAWILAKPKIRLQLAKELMKAIHFPLMTFKEFKEVQRLNMWSDHSLVELYEAIFEDFCSSETAPQNQCRIYLPKENLVLIGGDQISEDMASRSISKELWFGNSLRNHTGVKKAVEWRKLSEMPEPARFCHEVAVLKGQLYVFGGKKYYGTGDMLNSAYRYDPDENGWQSLADMQEKRCSFSVVVLDGKIYAIGGLCDPDYTDSVERYCPTANSWSFTCPLDLPLGGHVAKVLRGQIYVSGGLNSDYSCLSSMFLYHPETGSTYLENMTQPRAHHCMEALGDCLYTAGGITADRNNTVTDQLACEVYDPAADSWTAFTYLKVPHVGAGSAVMEGKFYVLGGYSQEDYSDTKMVHRYDPATQMWENMGKMPGPNNDLRACLLCLPSHFRL